MTAAIHLPTDGRAIYATSFAAACRPRKRLTVSQWADAHRVLTPKASSEPGPWRTERVPYLREIMDCLSVNSPVQSVTVKKSSQTGGTEVGLNWLGYIMEHAPAPTLVVVPTLEVRKRWVRQRLDEMITASKDLLALFDARRKRDATNSEEMKDFPNGMVIIGGANSPASLAAMPIKFVITDEVDRFPRDVGDEGDPLGLIRVRQDTFPRRKALHISSPTIKDASTIDEMFEAGDQRHYHVPCPHCGELQVLVWENLRWTVDPATNQVKRVIYACRHCGAEIEEHYKIEMLREAGHGGRARWIPARPGVAERSYHINALYAPLGLGRRWTELAQEWLQCQTDVVKLKRFVNTKLGECWEDRSRDIRPNALMERGEPYGLREIPRGCLILTCGVDTQDDRLALQLLGWGRNETCWTLDWLELPGDPGRPELWAKLAEYLNRPLLNSFGKELRIEATAIDTGGHFTHEVYAFARSHAARRLMAIKGSSTPSRPILAGRPQEVDVNWKGKIIKGGVKLWLVGTDTAKHALSARLTGDANVEAAARQIRFSNALPLEYYEQLTAEAFDPEHNKWVKRRGRRNEGMDTWVYGTAAAQHPELRVHAMRPVDWSRLEALLEPATAQDTPEIPKHTDVSRDSTNTSRKQAAPKRGGFTTRWRQ